MRILDRDPMPLVATRLLDEPIIRPHMDQRMGDNINGPALIRMPDWAGGRLGRYHLYFSNHKGGYIRLAYADALVVDGGRVPDALFERLHAMLSDEEILELTYVTMTYELHATMCRALRLEYDDVDERIVEIPAPTEAANVDVMRSVDE